MLLNNVKLDRYNNELGVVSPRGTPMNPPTFRLSRRLDGVSESATLKLNALVNQMKAQGLDVVNLTAGEPDFAPPEAAKKAVHEAVDANKSKYTPTPGIPELR